MENKMSEKQKAAMDFVQALGETLLSYNKIYEDVAEYESSGKEMDEVTFTSILSRIAWEKESTKDLDDEIVFSDEFFDLIKEHYSREIVFALVKRVREFNAMADVVIKRKQQPMSAWEVSLRNRRIEK
jgi:hypothetical protein